jgi:hypothetical protein
MARNFKRDRSKYVRYQYREHPLANRGGQVSRHRVVLWQAMGLDWDDLGVPVACHWCGYRVPWTDRRGPEYCVNVDHLNIPAGERMADTPNNLVPSCGWCNKTRAKLIKAGVEHWDVLLLAFKTTHPADRPTPTKLQKLLVSTAW